MTNKEIQRWRNSKTRQAKSRDRGQYDADWKRLRAYKLSQQPFCELNKTNGCTKDVPRIATCVDHEIPFRVNPGLRLEPV